MTIPRPAESHRVWTVADLLSWTESYFRKLGFPTARLDAEVLLAKALGCTRIELYTGYRRVVEPAERDRYREFVERRGRSEPVAYITGEREFHSLRFEVGPSVLIPRPETEHLVDVAVERLRARAGLSPKTGRAEPLEAHAGSTEGGTDSPIEAAAAVEGGASAAVPLGEQPPAAPDPAPAPEPVRVLDLGTGSGNIAVAMAVEVAWAEVVAVDRSAEALAVARRNAAALGVAERILFLEGDLFAPVHSLGEDQRFHAILSNPPYIPTRDRAGLMADVRDFEPPGALFDTRDGPEGDGLGFHRAIAREAPAHLAPGGVVAVEVGAGQAPAVAEIFRSAGLREVQAVADYGGISRVVIGEAPGGPGSGQ